MLGFLLILVVILLLLNPKLLPALGTWLGLRARKPVRQAQWIWSSLAGTEDESIQAEFEYGKECARAFMEQFPANASRSDQKFASHIGSMVADAVQDSRRKFHFQVAVSPVANAFALPGGFVFITSSLLQLCRYDRDETAFLLGHEIAHILKGHAKDHMTANAFLDAVMSRMPAAGQMLRHVVSKGYSRILELEADKEGARLAVAAGFDGRASVRALERLAQGSPDPAGLSEYLSSHPPLSERVRELEKMLAEN